MEQGIFLRRAKTAAKPRKAGRSTTGQPCRGQDHRSAYGGRLRPRVTVTADLAEVSALGRGEAPVIPTADAPWPTDAAPAPADRLGSDSPVQAVALPKKRPLTPPRELPLLRFPLGANHQACPNDFLDHSGPRLPFVAIRLILAFPGPLEEIPRFAFRKPLAQKCLRIPLDL